MPTIMLPTLKEPFLIPFNNSIRLKLITALYENYLARAAMINYPTWNVM